MPGFNTMAEDDGFGREMIGRLADAVARMETAVSEMDKLVRGNGKAGLGEQIRNNRALSNRNAEKIDQIRAGQEEMKRTLEVLANPGKPSEETRWKALGQIAVALTAAVSLALQVLT